MQTVRFYLDVKIQLKTYINILGARQVIVSGDLEEANGIYANLFSIPFGLSGRCGYNPMYLKKVKDNLYILMITVATTLDSTSDFPIMFFTIEVKDNISLFSTVADKYFKVIYLFASKTNANIPSLFAFAGQENTLAILILKSENVGNIYEIQDYTYSPDIVTFLFSGTIHVDACKCELVFNII